MYVRPEHTAHAQSPVAHRLQWHRMFTVAKVAMETDCLPKQRLRYGNGLFTLATAEMETDCFP